MPQLPAPYCSVPGCPCRKPCPTHKPKNSSKGKRIEGPRQVRRRRIFLARQPICAKCGNALAAELDHRIPLSQGGAEDWSNLQGLCRDCHRAKTRQERQGA